MGPGADGASQPRSGPSSHRRAGLPARRRQRPAGGSSLNQPQSGQVFSRARGGRPSVAVRAEGVWIEDQSGKRYLDGASGALVCGIGHGRPEIARVLSTQAQRVDYVHSTAFTTEVLEEYAAALGEVLPVDEPRLYPVSGGSEAVETALKLARSFHLARGEGHRTRVLARWGSYHGNTLGALDVSGRQRLRAPYQIWLGRFDHLPPVYEYRCPAPTHPNRCGAWHAQQLEQRIVESGDVAAFIAEPIGGATLGATVPADDYWPAVAEVCRRHGVLLIADEVMSGFGRSGRWFGIDHWDVRPDILVAGKGVSSGYWPLGLCVASGAVWEAVAEGGFVHGFTYSHHPIGAAVGLAVLRILQEEALVERASLSGLRLMKALSEVVNGHPLVGEIRGRGLLLALELVADVTSKEPFPAQTGISGGLFDACLEAGLVVYPSTGCVDGIDGDLVLIGPPLVATDDELDQLVDRLGRSLTKIGLEGAAAPAG